MTETRLAWPDATRALCVVAVVIYHCLIWNYNWMNSPASAPGGPWSTVDAILGRTRMPLLFALSGLLASRGLLAGFRRGTGLRRAASSYYLYLLWLAVYLVFFSLLPSAPYTPGGLESWLSQLVIPTSTLWFIFALALFPLLILGFRALRIPVWAVLVLALGAWQLSNTVVLVAGSDKLLRNFLFFAIGVYGASLLRRAADVRWPVALALVLLFAGVATAGMTVRGGWPLDAALLMLTNLTAIPALIAVVALACHLPPIARLGGFLGRRTLHIYVLHIPVLAGVTALLYLSPSTLYFAVIGNPVIDALYPLALTTVVIVMSLLIGSLLERITGGRAFHLPSRWDAALLARQERAGGPLPARGRRAARDIAPPESARR